MTGEVDPNIVMLDQLVRVVLAEAIKAAVWVAVALAAVRRFRSK